EHDVDGTRDGAESGDRSGALVAFGDEEEISARDTVAAALAGAVEFAVELRVVFGAEDQLGTKFHRVGCAGLDVGGLEDDSAVGFGPADFPANFNVISGAEKSIRPGGVHLYGCGGDSRRLKGATDCKADLAAVVGDDVGDIRSGGQQGAGFEGLEGRFHKSLQ